MVAEFGFNGRGNCALGLAESRFFKNFNHLAGRKPAQLPGRVARARLGGILLDQVFKIRRRGLLF